MKGIKYIKLISSQTSHLYLLECYSANKEFMFHQPITLAKLDQLTRSSKVKMRIKTGIVYGLVNEDTILPCGPKFVL